MSEEEIVKAISGGDKVAVNFAMDSLYESTFPSVRTYILRNSGTLEEAHDIFQDAIVVFFVKVRKGTYSRESSLKTYLHGISSNLWLKELRKRRVAERYLTSHREEQVTEETIIHENQITLRRVLELIDKECRQLLLDFYFKSKSVKELMTEYGLGSEAATKNKKYRCLQKLIRTVRENKLNRSDFDNE